MEKQFIAARVKEGMEIERSWCGYKRPRQGILVLMEIFGALTLSILKSWL